ncbi:hypothetical protein AVEN_161434-1 [Araneus ventricosus]|uniref:Uncharacterized protein n=1 Tax=Araneus ventricosus TaxID=182803 RepID=A0A4Y2M3J9_ARAVE|nr:hypothetical protein AVEN_161434-1 [Araneus ventricosus]
MQVDDVPPSADATNTIKIANETKFPLVNSVPKPMPIDAILDNETDNVIESSSIDDAIHYDPNEAIGEAIGEMSPVIEQQPPVTNPATSDKATPRQKLKKSSF